MLQLLSSEQNIVATRLSPRNDDWLMDFFPFLLFFLFSFRLYHLGHVCGAHPNVPESEPGCNGSWLRQNRNVRTNWEGHFGVQCVRYRVTTLVRHVGVPAKTYCSMAHSERSRRRRGPAEEVSCQPASYSLPMNFQGLITTQHQENRNKKKQNKKKFTSIPDNRADL